MTRSPRRYVQFSPNVFWIFAPWSLSLSQPMLPTYCIVYTLWRNEVGMPSKKFYRTKIIRIKLNLAIRHFMIFHQRLQRSHNPSIFTKGAYWQLLLGIQGVCSCTWQRMDKTCSNSGINRASKLHIGISLVLYQFSWGNWWLNSLTDIKDAELTNVMFIQGHSLSSLFWSIMFLV